MDTVHTEKGEPMTDKDIQNVIKAINECFWRKDIGGVYICRGDIVETGDTVEGWLTAQEIIERIERRMK